MTGPRCNGCDVDVIEIREQSYMLRPTLWEVVEPTGRGVLCIGCIERRLKRKLDLHDFDLMRANTDTERKRSERLTDRLQGFREQCGEACERTMQEIMQINAREVAG